MNTLTTKMFLMIGLTALAVLPGAKAEPWNQKTILTFSGPVQIPGQVLPAGTYVFKLADSSSNRHIVQVFNKDENHVFGTFLAIPDFHLRPSSETIIKFEERAAGSPQAIKAWFYPGRNYGHEFVYPKKEAVELASTNHTPVPAMPTELTPDTIKPDVALDAPEVIAISITHVMAEEPGGEEVELNEAFPAADTPAPAMPEKLPSTATALPLIGLIGLTLLATGGVLRLGAARVK
jgi:hypothetical protein